MIAEIPVGCEAAMETMKPMTEMTDPDPRVPGFGVANVSDGTTRSMTLEDFYKSAEKVQVNVAAPEDVRSYMAAVKSLFAYGWFCYPFFTLSAFLATTAVEMALRAKFAKKGDDHRGLGTLFKRALSEGVLRDENFPSREHVLARRKMWHTNDPEAAEAPSVEFERPYAELVAGKLIHFRNVFAHPRSHWILFPGQALDFLVSAAEVINQLWPGGT